MQCRDVPYSAWEGVQGMGMLLFSCSEKGVGVPRYRQVWCTVVKIKEYGKRRREFAIER